MIIYEDKTYTTRVVELIRCDCCGKESKYRWATGGFDIEEVCIKYESGKHYPEGRFTKIIEADICPECFKDIIIPTLEKVGVKFLTRESDF